MHQRLLVAKAANAADARRCVACQKVKLKICRIIDEISMTKIFGIGIYDKEDYKEILRISEDRDQMDLTWEDWKKSK